LERNQKHILCEILEILLDSVLKGKPFPGQDATNSFFPDIEILKDVDPVVISDQHLGGRCQIDIPGKNFLVLSNPDIEARADMEGDFPYFVISQATVSESEVTISLQLKWAMSEASRKVGIVQLSGGGIQIQFKHEEGQWLAPDGPRSVWMT
jgi:hypothetical protein